MSDRPMDRQQPGRARPGTVLNLLPVLLLAGCIGSATGDAEADPHFVLTQPVEGATITCMGNAELGGCHMDVERPELDELEAQAVLLPVTARGDSEARRAALEKILPAASRAEKRPGSPRR